MKLICRLFAAVMVCCLLLCGSVSGAMAAQTSDEPAAENLTGPKLFAASKGFEGLHIMYDGAVNWGIGSEPNASLTLAHEKGIASLSIRFSFPVGEYTITDTESGTEYVWTQKYLHDFVDLKTLFGYVPKSVKLSFGKNSVTINELTAFSEGKLPDDVQVWQEPKDDETDLVIFSTHGDDEHLFFGGIMPYYAGELGYQVQVVYLTNHVNSYGYIRMHEMLDGLWAAGIRSYPVFGKYYDFRVDTLEEGYNFFRALGSSEEDMVGFVVEQLRRFKPTVAVGHDFNGEYGHGQHIVFADMLAKAVKVSSDPDKYPELTEKYGTWDPPKVYMHLYQENPIVMDWDQPLEHFDGKTAWEVSSKVAYRKHVSQQDIIKEAIWFFGNVEKAADIKMYSPCNWGLYYSTVGDDVQKNDFFENTVTYAQKNGTAPMPEVPEETVPETEPEELPEQTLPVQTEPAQQSEKEGSGRVYPVWPFFVIAGAVITAGISLTSALLEKKKEK